MGNKASTTARRESEKKKKAPPKGSGKTERLVSRAARLSQQQQAALKKGSVSSSTSTELTAVVVDNETPKTDQHGKLVPEEVVKRTLSSALAKEAILGSPENQVAVEYAHRTQRGYYPDDPHKANQDEWSVLIGMAQNQNNSNAGQNVPQDAMFAVYDGHGTDGHQCAAYAKKQLPKLVAKHVRQERVKKYKRQLKQQGVTGATLWDPAKWPFLLAEEYKGCCRRAFLECNTAMHKDPAVQDKMSGTTAITVHFHADFMCVCNVGDSRAVLGHLIPANGGSSSLEDSVASPAEETKVEIEDDAMTEDANGMVKPQESIRSQLSSNQTVLAIPLSRDQTPYRKDERERVKRHGAAIMSIDQMEGHEEMHENWGDMVLGDHRQDGGGVDIHGDPPRVWVEGKDYPGTAFTRSIGDCMADEIGVTAEPEMLARTLTSNDKLLVIASDGVFEFLTNQEVVDICIQCASPVEACERVVKAAYEQWIIYENRTDDITVIVCFLNCSQDPAGGKEGTTEDLVVLAKSMYGSKPVRKKPRGKNDTLFDSSDVVVVEDQVAVPETATDPVAAS